MMMLIDYERYDKKEGEEEYECGSSFEMNLFIKVVYIIIIIE